MNESLEKAAANSTRQYLNTSNGQSVPDGTYETILIYNPTRGLIPDMEDGVQEDWILEWWED